MKEILTVEKLKLKRSKLWILYILGPLIGVTLAYTNFYNNYKLFVQPGDNEWIEAWTQVAIFMGPFVLPIMVGVYAAFVCRSEHVSGGWKHLLALPVQRTKIFLGKFLITATMVAVTLFIVLILFLGFGLVKGVNGELPMLTLIGYCIKGFLACLPLMLLQLIISIRSKTFGIPLAISIVFTLPAIIVASTPLGQIYPWTQPMLAMSPADESPIESYFTFYTLLSILSIALLYFGIRNFAKRDIL
ncbi:ABC transporter permease [Priestia megaterium]|uniref:ABC transporter permease n=1 Tax=Priestia megaterium TaxID=1404 RepID=UPI00298C407C|nr:ABC transporter permease [Priestia megaterium]